MTNPGYKLIYGHIKALKQTGGTMLIENRQLRPFTENEYFIFSTELGMGLNTSRLTESSKKQIAGNEYNLYLESVAKFTGRKVTPQNIKLIKEAVKISDYKVTISLLMEENPILDKKIKNPETGRTIKVKSALSPDHPAYDKAKAIVQKAGGDVEDEHGHDDHGHHDDGLSAKEKALLGAADVALKKIPVVNVIAGQSEAIYKKMKDNPFDEVKKAKGFINKAKAFGKASKQTISNWKESAQQEFANSMTDEATGERKSLAKVIGTKAKAAGKAIVNGLKEEAKHIAHELGEGVSGIKDIIKDPKSIKDPAVQKKLATGLKGLATTAVVGMAAASGPAGMALKAASLAINPGDGVRAMLTASVYISANGRGYLSELTENRHKIMRLIESKVDKLDESFMVEVYGKFGSKELNEVESPTNDYSESDMDKVVKYTDMTNNIQSATKGDEK